MLLSLKFSCVAICLLIYVHGGMTLFCYFCNTRDHVGCDNILFGQNDTLLRECEGPCSIVKGQWGYPGDRKVMLWRGCAKIALCTQENSLCCHCTKDFCNYGNECFSGGSAQLPRVVVLLSVMPLLPCIL